MIDEKRVHLGYGKAGKKQHGYSGRAVRFRVLSTSELDHIKDLVAGKVDDNTKMAQYNDMLATLGVEQMVTGVSEPVAPESLGSAPIRSLTPKEMFEERTKLFTTKDFELLKRLYFREHHVSDAEVDDIMGGIVGVVD